MLRKAICTIDIISQKGCIFCINAYRILISSWTKSHCRFYPTCSSYAKEAFQKHGTLRGLYFTLCRLLRCHPFHPGGIDPVPEKKVRPDGH